MADDVVSPSSLCHCSDLKAVHVHCFCGVCNDKAVNYRTQISHLRLSTSYGTERTEEQHECELVTTCGSDRYMYRYLLSDSIYFRTAEEKTLKFGRKPLQAKSSLFLR